MSALIDRRNRYHSSICKKVLVYSHTDKHGWNATNADADNAASKLVGNALAKTLGAKKGKRLAAQTLGKEFEDATCEFVKGCFADISHLQVGTWTVERETSRSPLVIAKFSQYAHLQDVFDASKNNPKLAAVLGRDYSVASDVLVYRNRLDDDQLNKTTNFVSANDKGEDHLRLANGTLPYLHASVSCKWTMRSDRAQNTRTEALDLIRKRKGRVPHIVAVTAEPLPSRLSSLCLGTGDLDCVYHIALPELRDAIVSLNQSEALDLLDLMIDGGRIKDISDLPLDLFL